MRRQRYIKGILVVYHHVLIPNAATIMEHVNAFGDHSSFKVWKVNTEIGFPRWLDGLEFQVIVLHYSLFGSGVYQLNERFLDYLSRCSRSYKVAFFQDEYYYCVKRFNFLNDYEIDCVYTLLAPEHWDKVYRRYTRVPRLEYTIPGYVSQKMVEAAEEYALTDHERTVDIGYRGRQLPFWLGKGAQEKYWIAGDFKRHCPDSSLSLDIETAEDKRFYGDDWYRFMGNSRGVLGVEAGVSIYDLEDEVRSRYEEIIREKPEIRFEELSEILLEPWEDQIPYRTISPRHFEAAAFRSCQILFEGNYSGIMLPMVHYLPLKKDFSNIVEVLEMFKDPLIRQRLTDTAYNDLIASGRYTYKNFVTKFDQNLVEEGIVPANKDLVAFVVNLNRHYWESVARVGSWIQNGRKEFILFASWTRHKVLVVGSRCKKGLLFCVRLGKSVVNPGMNKKLFLMLRAWLFTSLLYFRNFLFRIPFPGKNYVKPHAKKVLARLGLYKPDE